MLFCNFKRKYTEHKHYYHNYFKWHFSVIVTFMLHGLPLCHPSQQLLSFHRTGTLSQSNSNSCHPQSPEHRPGNGFWVDSSKESPEFVFLWLAYFKSHHVVEVHSCCSVFQNFLPCGGCLMSTCMCILPFAYPFHLSAGAWVASTFHHCESGCCELLYLTPEDRAFR